MGQWDFCNVTTKRKYAMLTTDLRNTVVNKKIIWAE